MNIDFMSHTTNRGADMKFCSHCRHEVLDDAVLCPHCGNIFEKKSTPEKSLTVLEWIGTIFLLCIPAINIVSALVFLCQRRKSKTRSNFIIAMLVLMISMTMILGILYYFFGSRVVEEVIKIWETLS